MRGRCIAPEVLLVAPGIGELPERLRSLKICVRLRQALPLPGVGAGAAPGKESLSPGIKGAEETSGSAPSEPREEIEGCGGATDSYLRSGAEDGSACGKLVGLGVEANEENDAEENAGPRAEAKGLASFDDGESEGPACRTGRCKERLGPDSLLPAVGSQPRISLRPVLSASSGEIKVRL